jgi:hypothetical protein
MQEVYFMYSQSGEFGVSKFNSVLPRSQQNGHKTTSNGSES